MKPVNFIQVDEKPNKKGKKKLRKNENGQEK